ncbi:MAG: Ribosomal small subunit methyltransferase [Gemmatimonadetes bacterium]|nr:Ribosomal small subunit methyltransferase [Gemmatimonadota bacterium]
MVDGENHAPVATFYAPGTWTSRVELDERAAHHALVKRLVVGDAVRLTGGDGRRVSGHVEALSKRALAVECIPQSLHQVPALAHVELWAPVGDRDRMLWLAEKATELGVSAWRSVVYRRSRSVSPRGEGDAFLEKLRARMIAALEQSGGAWLPEILPEETIDAVARCTHAGGAILLDPLGQPLADLMSDVHAPVVIALGPEGGLESDERGAFESAGWRTASIGGNVLRFETAGIGGLTLVRSLLRSA